MSDYDEDVFFDEEDEKEKIEKEIISEDDFDEDFGEKTEKKRYTGIQRKQKKMNFPKILT